jgi:hypothetical protein
MIILRKIYIFSDTHLPENGWLQGCYECGGITSRTILYKTKYRYKKKYKFIMHLCPRCKRQLEKNSQQNNKLINRCNIFIDSFLNSC